jgi:hypothetical protein
MNKAKPILFSTPMVKALLEGRKSQTRRVVKGVGKDWIFDHLMTHPAEIAYDKNGDEYPKELKGLYATFRCDGDPEFPMIKSPYQIGDILWVRETWALFPSIPMQYVYKVNEKDKNHCLWKWKPSRFMPREAARIFLRVTDMRLERVQDISPKDIISEGVDVACDPLCVGGCKLQLCFVFRAWKELWDSLNAKRRGCSWDENPLVWVIEFVRVDNAKNKN